MIFVVKRASYSEKYGDFIGTLKGERRDTINEFIFCSLQK